MGSIADSLKRQYDLVWEILYEMIDFCPDDLWRRPDEGHLVPGRLAFHAVQAVEFHLDENPHEFDGFARGIDWETCLSQDLPSGDAMKAYVEEVRGKAVQRIEQLGDEGLLSPDKTMMRDDFPLAIDHVIYALRHLQYHLGQIDTLLHQRGSKSPDWR